MCSGKATITVGVLVTFSEIQEGGVAAYVNGSSRLCIGRYYPVHAIDDGNTVLGYEVEGGALYRQEENARQAILDKYRENLINAATLSR